MNLFALQQSKRPFFTVQNLAQILGITPASARVFASRYSKKGLLSRLKNNLYVLSSKIETMESEDLFRLSSLIQTPSYISFSTALSFYQASTQIPRQVVEAVSLVRSVQHESNPLLFCYSKLKKSLYFGYIRQNGFFIAEREKALLDALYLMSLGRYSLDLSSLDLKSFSSQKLEAFAQHFPSKTQRLLKEVMVSSASRG